VTLACQDCNCGRGQGRNCKLRQPRDLTRGERAVGLLLLIVLAAGLLASLSGCQREEVVAANRQTIDQQLFANHVIADPDTGCQYINFSGSGVTPRIADDGRTQMGCKGGTR
jgi:hypothetical protein